MEKTRNEPHKLMKYQEDILNEVIFQKNDQPEETMADEWHAVFTLMDPDGEHREIPAHIQLEKKETEMVDPNASDEFDIVERPKHYINENGVECKDWIKMMLTPEEYRGWLKGSALGYQFRAGKKGTMEDAILDLDKAKEFLMMQQDEFMEELK